MRIAISALVGIAMTASVASVSAQPAARSDVPPPPPPPGSVVQPEPPPPLPPFFPVEGGDRNATAGWDNGFFIRDSHDWFRLFPKALVQTDVYGFFGPGVTKVPASNGGTGLKTRLFLRRARLELAGEVLKRWTFLFAGDFGGEQISNPDGTGEKSAAGAGKAPTADTARYAPVQGAGTAIGLANAWINYSASLLFNVQLGQFNVPFSLENRTTDDFIPWMERNLAIRGFVVTSSKDLGGLVWGELPDRVLSYELGVFGGDGQNRPSVDNRVDFIGRIFARPFALGATSSLAKYAQIGVSARHGERDPKSVGYDYPAITTGQGWMLWKPTYTDSLGRQIHVLASGAQNSIGGELRLRTDRFALQGEAYYVHNDTREAVDGFQLTNTERLGRVAGVGWYAQLSAWPVGDAFVPPEPGIHRPRTLNVERKKQPQGVEGHWPRGLELMVIAAGVNANYDGGARKGSVIDPRTPKSDITVYELGFGAQYWHTKHVRVAMNYIAYLAPGSGDASKNLAVVPDNIAVDGQNKPGESHVVHELGGRVALSF